MSKTATLYAPPDTEAAYAAWGANCGPAALAALIGVPVNDVRGFFGAFDQKRYVNPTDMQAALKAAGATFRLTPSNADKPGRALPKFGVAFLQLSGGWWDGKPVGVQYRHTHWVAIKGEGDDLRMYDVNAPDGWCNSNYWEDFVWTQLAEASGATDVWCRTAYEVGRCR